MTKKSMPEVSPVAKYFPTPPLTKSNKRGGKSPTSKISDWQPKTGKSFRDTKRPMQGVSFPKGNKPYP